MTQFNDIQQIKRRFFAMRNGITADALRKGGSPFKIIFGLNLPQIVEIANETGFNRELAAKLWANKTTRESRLLAPMLIEPQQLSLAEALSMALDCETTETADVLCHRLLRKSPEAQVIANELEAEGSEMACYCALRILWHFISINPLAAKEIAQRELQRNRKLTQFPAQQILDELDFLESDI
ncbi:MAG: hypothetical protein NC338_06315 [Firmicutes bacterium]|nr:hypothetical protein [Bacillota bacterium]MCM1401596.1 hypothetical protein [Bacteroides sp.]MCM1477242.1 hypothetical protein [Bacteroides sp.]